MSLLSTYRNALPPGARLLWYRIERVLGQGAFGITYLATDDNLHRPVAIKEYLPGHLARRETDDTVQPLTAELAPEYSAGLRRFLSEARTLARFEHPNIVRIHNVFEHLGTACMVMQYEAGTGLDILLRQRRRLDAVRKPRPLLQPTRSRPLCRRRRSHRLGGDTAATRAPIEDRSQTLPVIPPPR
jgi:serine/threonine protein kinase